MGYFPINAFGRYTNLESIFLVLESAGPEGWTLSSFRASPIIDVSQNVLWLWASSIVALIQARTERFLIQLKV